MPGGVATRLKNLRILPDLNLGKQNLPKTGYLDSLGKSMSRPPGHKCSYWG